MDNLDFKLVSIFNARDLKSNIPNSTSINVTDDMLRAHEINSLRVVLNIYIIKTFVNRQLWLSLLGGSQAR